ncbi:MAG TPA: hypothetical protein VK419_17805 [Bryobacteraceae bacterium]|nr:hypothetical protein [Bryobacteraceae bacterium]
MKIETLRSPLSIDRVRDGGFYALPPAPLVQTNLFLKIGRVDELFLKVPSERGFEDYRKFIREGLIGPESLRPLEEQERFEKLDAALDRSGLRPALAAGADIAHYLAVHAIQYERLKAQTAVGVPRVRFAVSRRRRLGILSRYEPVMFQERIAGTTLWEMFDFDALRVKSQWRPFLAGIAAQLQALMDAMANHIDWNIQNFVFEPMRRRVFYVDLKPTVFLAGQSNELNVKGIRDYFLV